MPALLRHGKPFRHRSFRQAQRALCTSASSARPSRQSAHHAEHAVRLRSHAATAHTHGAPSPLSSWRPVLRHPFVFVPSFTVLTEEATAGECCLVRGRIAEHRHDLAALTLHTLTLVHSCHSSLGQNHTDGYAHQPASRIPGQPKRTATRSHARTIVPTTGKVTIHSGLRRGGRSDCGVLAGCQLAPGLYDLSTRRR